MTNLNNLYAEEQEAPKSDAAALRHAKLLMSLIMRTQSVTDPDRLKTALSAMMMAVWVNGREGSVCALGSDLKAALARLESSMQVEEATDLLAATSLAVVLGEKGSADARSETHPFVIEKTEGSADAWRFYTQQSFCRECSLAERLCRLYAGAQTVAPAADARKEGARAVDLAVANRLTVVSGGPGTGKTSAVSKVLVKLLDVKLLETKQDLSIVLVAPTGKAAGRMRQAVLKSLSDVADEKIKSILETLDSGTIHKLLTTVGIDGERPSEKSPLTCDVIVIDEASMVDIDLADRLFRCIDPARTKVIVLGDRYQLAAVGPGAVFADLCDPQGALADGISHLTFSYRFASDKAVGTLARLINGGEVEGVLDHLRTLTVAGVSEIDNAVYWHNEDAKEREELTPAARRWLTEMAGNLAKAVKKAQAELAAGGKERTDAYETVAQECRKYGVLAPNRHGAMSVEAVNKFVDKKLEENGLVGNNWRLVIVRRNDDELGVHNGDVGLVVPSGEKGESDVYFLDARSTLRLALLPNYDPAFAITVHQSQGSEYEHVALMMGSGCTESLATRELLYTAVTRVKDEKEEDGEGTRRGTLDLFAPESVVRKSVETVTVRKGGLAARLKEYADG